jgi:cellobiose phosphorylase
MPGNVNGPHAAQPGQGGWTWYTGSAAWYLRSLVEGVLGVTAHLEGLQVMADLPTEWDGFRLQRRFRGAAYHIEVRRVRAEEIPGCVVNGRVHDGNVLPLAAPGTVQTVQVLV